MMKRKKIPAQICTPSEYAKMIGKSVRWVQLQCNADVLGQIILPGASSVIRSVSGRYTIILHGAHESMIAQYKRRKK